MTIRRRIRRLEEKSQPEEVIGIRIADGPVRARSEEMLLEAFERRYPEARLIQVVYVNTPRGDRKNSA